MPGAPNVPLDKAAHVEALAELGYSQREAGKLAGVTKSTVADILGRHGKWGEICEGPVWRELRASQKKTFQAAMFELTRKSLIHAESKLPKASYFQAVTGAAILMDKERLYAGEPTEIQASLNIKAAIALDDLAAALATTLIPEPIDVTPAKTPDPVRRSKKC